MRCDKTLNSVNVFKKTCEDLSDDKCMLSDARSEVSACFTDVTRCQYWHFRGILWPHLFPLYAWHIFKASLLRYGVLEIMRNFILTRGRYISEGYFYFLSYYSRAYEKLFSDDPARLYFITSLKNVRGSITLKTYRQVYLYILTSRQNTICQ